VPFADHRGLVSRILEHFRESRLGAVEAAVVVVEEAVEVRVFAGQNRGTGWAADGISAERVVKDHAFFGDAIDVRGRGNLVKAFAVSGDGFGGVVVGEDEDDIRVLCGCAW